MSQKFEIDDRHLIVVKRSACLRTDRVDFTFPRFAEDMRRDEADRVTQNSSRLRTQDVKDDVTDGFITICLDT